jgi:hypothetical protein
VFNVGSQVESVARLIRPLVGGRIQIDVHIGDPDCFAIADIARSQEGLPVNLGFGLGLNLPCPCALRARRRGAI